MGKLSLKILQCIGLIGLIPLLAISGNWYLFPTVFEDIFGFTGKRKREPI